MNGVSLTRTKPRLARRREPPLSLQNFLVTCSVFCMLDAFQSCAQTDTEYVIPTHISRQELRLAFALGSPV
jgi:hypothetical protein